ncbi:MAG: Eco57I restriction-modification methylase domain-containing protein, partial [Candidatus Cloacimonetes bacterium]|nr:Eco57I restriction-modification methylase domain-containing protein [Candidatus Cloacimonadota bacterium]
MQNLLNSAYSRESWISFLQNRFLPDDFQLRKEVIAINFKSNYIQPTAFWIGDCASLGDLAIIEISHNSVKDPRIGVSRDAFRLMALHNLDKALFFFVSDNSKNFRFSLITLDLQLKDKRVEYQFSNPKRFSFFLGEGAKTKTPQNFLIAKNRVRSFADLQERFSVEVVNKEFYQEIQSLFYRLVGGKIKLAGRLQDFPARLCLPGTKDRQQMQEFGVRLIGRLVFCWFLKKKLSDAGLPLIPEAVLSSMAVMDSYYHKVLEPLFFEILNTPLGKRSSEFRSPLYDKIPFLNGGLFDPSLHQDFYYHPTSAQKHQPCYTLKVPDDWLRDFFSTLETYNFTIDENIPIDIDLSVDPEMLGRIFENLLAEINPETGKNAQNATGSFYTPRPIVEYMVNESLVQYLLHKSSVSEAVLRALLDYNIEEVELSKAQCGEILKALDTIKVLDPACGSGAFPIGILQKMLLILQKVDPESVDWLILQLDKVPVSIRKSVEDKMMNENWNYQHKMGIIQNAIYGVDLQPVATEISKLRLFLTLIVDEKIIDNQPNRNINPLPNLSFKFVSANTLLPLPDPQQEAQMEALDFDSVFEPKIKAMQRAREDYFFAFGEAKEKLIQKFKDIQSELSKEFYATGSVNKRALALAKWEPFSDEPNEWFDSAWIFGISQGFDIVIGNPPYIQLQKDLNGKKKYADLYKDLGYQSFERTGDIYCLFYEKGYELLKTGGHLTFITSNKWMRAGYGKSLRHFLSANTRPQILLDLAALKVFDNATVDPNILIFQKTEPRPGSGF